MVLLGQKKKENKLLLYYNAIGLSKISCCHPIYVLNHHIVSVKSTHIHIKYLSLYSHATRCSTAFDPPRHPRIPSGGKLVLNQLLVQILTQTVRGLLGRGHTLERYLLQSLKLPSSPPQLDNSHSGMEVTLV